MKSDKNQKITKTGKVTKSENQKSVKSEKVIKLKVKSEKSHIFKNTPKWSKCQINGTFRHFVFSEPPGPAFFGFWGFQGVPRLP